MTDALLQPQPPTQTGFLSSLIGQLGNIPVIPFIPPANTTKAAGGAVLAGGQKVAAAATTVISYSKWILLGVAVIVALYFFGPLLLAVSSFKRSK